MDDYFEAIRVIIKRNNYDYLAKHSLVSPHVCTSRVLVLEIVVDYFKLKFKLSFKIRFKLEVSNMSLNF